MAAYRGPVPDLRGVVLGGLNFGHAAATPDALLEANKPVRKAA